jgi:hypothetical protein
MVAGRADDLPARGGGTGADRDVPGSQRLPRLAERLLPRLIQSRPDLYRSSRRAGGPPHESRRPRILQATSAPAGQGGPHLVSASGGAHAVRSGRRSRVRDRLAAWQLPEPRRRPDDDAEPAAADIPAIDADAEESSVSQDSRARHARPVTISRCSCLTWPGPSWRRPPTPPTPCHTLRKRHQLSNGRRACNRSAGLGCRAE